MVKRSVMKEFTFDAAHRLQGYNGPCGNLHGHTWKVQVGFYGFLKEEGNSTGMIIDFKDIKTETDKIKNLVDHKVILETGDPLIDQLTGEGEVCVVPFRVTAENLAEWIGQTIKADFVNVYETPTSCATWEK